MARYSDNKRRDKPFWSAPTSCHGGGWRGLERVVESVRMGVGGCVL